MGDDCGYVVIDLYMHKFTMDGDYGYKLTRKLWWACSYNLVLERLEGSCTWA